MKPTGDGYKKVLVVAESPGEEEDERGIQLIGKSGQLLRSTLKQIGVDLDRDCWKTNAVVCRCEGTPTPIQIECCRPLLMKTILEYNPDVVLLLGVTSVTSLIGHLWKNSDIGGISRWVGWKIPNREPNMWICPTYHPAYLLRRRDNEVLHLWFKKHLEQAFRIEGKPWDEAPDYNSRLMILQDPDEAVGVIEDRLRRHRYIAFDFETDRVKPDMEGATIITCSVCIGGEVSISFPWWGKICGYMSSVFRDEGIYKIGCNIKFEERWVRRLLGHGVEGWVWDCMLAAHVLDNRPGITGLKFQAFVRRGVPDWSVGIDMGKVEGGNDLNSVKLIPVRELMNYNAIDSLMTYEVAKDQMEEMGVLGEFSGI